MTTIIWKKGQKGRKKGFARLASGQQSLKSQNNYQSLSAISMDSLDFLDLIRTRSE